MALFISHGSIAAKETGMSDVMSAVALAEEEVLTKSETLKRDPPSRLTSFACYGGQVRGDLLAEVAATSARH